jgi:hypothetical protein
VSDGGNSITGGSIGDIIRFRGMNTYVGPNATCTSICAFIWLAGRAKFVAKSSHIGVHGAYNVHTLQPSNEMNILLAVYLAQLGYNYDDVLWMLLPPPGNIHWLTPETTNEHHIYWAELSPTREQSGLYDYLPPAPSPAVASTPKSRPVAHYTAADNLNLRSGPRWDLPSALAKDEYIPAGTIVLAWQDEPCRPWEGAQKPYGSKDFWCPVYYKNPADQVTKGWVNAYYLLASDGLRMGERFAIGQKDDGPNAAMRGGSYGSFQFSGRSDWPLCRTASQFSVALCSSRRFHARPCGYRGLVADNPGAKPDHAIDMDDGGSIGPRRTSSCRSPPKSPPFSHRGAFPAPHRPA